MDNEATTAVDSAATSSAPATTTTQSLHEQTNSASGTRVPPLGECLVYIHVQLAWSVSEAVCYLQYEIFNLWLN